MISNENGASYYLHVGLPKTGTSFLQGQLNLHRQQLRAHGVLYPRLGKRGRFLAALDGRDQHTYAGVHRPAAAGRWAKFVDSTREFSGRVVFSHEIIGAPDGDKAPTALSMAGEHDVHVILTVRDPARQLASAWQQGLRYKSTMTFDEFFAQADLGPQEHFSRKAFRNQHVDSALRAWARYLPAERIHVVTVPPAGSPPGLLWERFCSVLSLDPGDFPVQETPRSNASLGVVQLEHLRRLNAAVGDRLSDEARAAHVRGFLVDALAKTTASARPVLPPAAHGEARALADRWITAIGDEGYDVVGDLEDLRPVKDEGEAPNEWAADELIAVGAETSAELLIAYTQAREELAKLRAAAAEEKPAHSPRMARKVADRVRGRMTSGAAPSTPPPEG